MNNATAILKSTNQARHIVAFSAVSRRAMPQRNVPGYLRTVALASIESAQPRDIATAYSAPASRLPPTRAAQPTRSRGSFLDAASTLVFAVIVTFAIAIAGAYPSLTRNLSYANPGPGLIASASVAPTFVFPTKPRR
jgi:hypothetical protein